MVKKIIYFCYEFFFFKQKQDEIPTWLRPSQINEIFHLKYFEYFDLVIVTKYLYIRIGMGLIRIQKISYT